MKLASRIKTSSGFKLDLFANFAGMGWTAIVQFACIPFYIKFLGIEAYGLIGFYLVLYTLLQALDLGLSPTVNREMARYSVQPSKAAEARDLVRTLESGYWLVGFGLGAGIIASAGLIATHWIKAGTFPVHSVEQVVMLMGVLAFFQWPVSFYHGGLMGLRRQVLYNAIRVTMVTLSTVGAVLVLWLVSHTIQTFFLWLTAVSALQSVTLAIFLWKSLPPSDRPPRFDLNLLRKIWHFAVGMTGITATALILTQADKVILSKLFTLRIFGYYTLAGTFGIGISMIIAAVFNTIFPRFSGMVATGDEQGIKTLYHQCTQLMAVLVLPVAAVVSLYSTEILLLWTRNPDVARHAGPIASVLVIGSAINALMNMPYVLQLAYGWTSIGLWINTCLVISLVPAIWYMATHYGPVGAASVWLILNAVYMLVGVPLTHRRLLRTEMTRWFVHDVLPASAAVVLVVGLAHAFFTGPMHPLAALLTLATVSLAAATAAALAAPYVRDRLLAKLSSLRSSAA